MTLTWGTDFRAQGGHFTGTLLADGVPVAKVSQDGTNDGKAHIDWLIAEASRREAVEAAGRALARERLSAEDWDLYEGARMLQLRWTVNFVPRPQPQPRPRARRRTA